VKNSFYWELIEIIYAAIYLSWICRGFANVRKYSRKS